MAEVEMSIAERLRKVQLELKAPKGQTNTFGKYKYRSCEDILEALKPLLNEYELTIVISDDIVQIGDRYYIKATVQVYNGDKVVETYALAREEEEKKGMDAAQITGSASSYARKYALNGLFAIDDTKDADSQDNREHVSKPPAKKDEVEWAKNWEIKNIQIAARKVIGNKPEVELDTWIENTLNIRLKQMPRAWVKPALDRLAVMEIDKLNEPTEE